MCNLPLYHRAGDLSVQEHVNETALRIPKVPSLTLLGEGLFESINVLT